MPFSRGQRPSYYITIIMNMQGFLKSVAMFQMMKSPFPLHLWQFVPLIHSKNYQKFNIFKCWRITNLQKMQTFNRQTIWKIYSFVKTGPVTKALLYEWTGEIRGQVPTYFTHEFQKVWQCESFKLSNTIKHLYYITNIQIQLR